MDAMAARCDAFFKNLPAAAAAHKAVLVPSYGTHCASPLGSPNIIEFCSKAFPVLQLEPVFKFGRCVVRHATNQHIHTYRYPVETQKRSVVAIGIRYTHTHTSSHGDRRGRAWNRAARRIHRPHPRQLIFLIVASLNMMHSKG
jgi:hypothetical protein